MDDIFNKTFWISQWEKDQKGDTSAVHKGYSTSGYWDKAALTYNLDKTEVESRRTEKTLAAFKEKGLLFKGMKVLDIGCGTGTLAIELAKRGADVLALDFSKGMLERTKADIPRPVAGSIILLQEDWHTIDINKKGWKEAFDLVIAFMSPGVSTPESFFKMMECSRKGCAIRGWARKSNNPVLEALWPKIMGTALEDKPQSILYKINLLFSIGFFPDISFDLVRWSQDTTVKDEFDRQVAFFKKISTEPVEKISQVVKTHLDLVSKGEAFLRQHEGLTATAIWEIQGKKTV